MVYPVFSLLPLLNRREEQWAVLVTLIMIRYATLVISLTALNVIVSVL
jgi:hypothetical protein